LRRAFRRAQEIIPYASRPTWILGYHLVEGGSGLVIDISRQRFLAQLDAIEDQGEVVGLEVVLRELRIGVRRGKQDRPRVVLTFDDAFLNFSQVVLPILVERALPATLYVPPGFVNGDGNHPLRIPTFERFRPMSWAQVREAAAAGIDIGSHTYNHRNLIRLPSAAIADEMRSSKFEIQRKTGVEVLSVCYPKGLVTSRVAGVAARFYPAGVTGGGRPLGSAAGSDLLLLPRLPIRRDLSPEALARDLRQRVNLEEWVADRARRVRGRFARRS
jgi:peptidoglycan/xylan/chitin deacetylase (PgdA/CDA1 family)